MLQYHNNDDRKTQLILTRFNQALVTQEEISFSEIQQWYDWIITHQMNRGQWEEMISGSASQAVIQNLMVKIQKDNAIELVSLMSVYTISGLVTPLHGIVTGLLIARFNPSASSLALTTWGLVVGPTFGFINSAGIHIQFGKENKEKTEAIIKTTWRFTLGLGLLCSLIFFSASHVMRFLVSHDTAQAYADFFRYFMGSPLAELMLMINPVIVLKRENNSQVQLYFTLLYRLSAIGLQYYFSIVSKMGIIGVGLGALVAGWGNVILLTLWFLHRRAIYREYINLLSIPSGYLKIFINDGWKLALQRMIEWINLFLISLILAIKDPQGLFAATPAIQIAFLVGLISQYMGMLAMMCFKELSKQYLHLLFWMNLISVSITGVLTILVCCLQDNIIDFVLGKNISHHERHLASILLIMSANSFAPDGVRLTTAGILRGLNELLRPTVVNFIFMTIFGVGCGALIGYGKKGQYAQSLFLMRTLTIALSALFNYYFSQKKINDPESPMPLSLPWCFDIFKKQKNRTSVIPMVTLTSNHFGQTST